MVLPSASINRKNSSIILQISLSERPLAVIYMDQESTVEAWDILIGFLRTHKLVVTQIESKKAYAHIIYLFSCVCDWFSFFSIFI